MHGVAIIGCGAMGGAHAAAWAERDDARIVSVYDIDATRAATLAEKTGAAACSSAEDAFTRDGVTVASICTPICFHADLTVLAAGHGLHVITEKAIALTLEDADRMQEAADANGVKLAVAYQLRTLPQYRCCRDLIAAKAFGGPVFVRFVDIRDVRPKLAMHTRSQNGGPLIDMAGHFVDLMRWFTGAEPTTVHARGHVFGKGKPRLASIADPAVDAAEILVTMSTGDVLSINVNWGMPEGHPGMCAFNITGPNLLVTQQDGKISARYADREVLHDVPPSPTGPAGRIADLLDAVKHDTPPEIGGPEGRAALAVCLAALESIETGETVELA